MIPDIFGLDSEHDIDQLIEKTEKEGDQIEQQPGGDSLFSFAKVWAAEKDQLEDMPDEVNDPGTEDSWAQTLERLAVQREIEKTQEATGRGVRRRAAAVFPQVCTNLPESAYLMFY